MFQVPEHNVRGSAGGLRQGCLGHEAAQAQGWFLHGGGSSYTLILYSHLVLSYLIISFHLIISSYLVISYNLNYILYLIISFHIILRWGVLTPQAWRRVWWGPRWGRWRSSGWQLTPPARTGPFSVKYSSRKQRDSSSRVPLDTQWDISQESHTMVPQMIIVTNVQWESSL